MTTPWTPELAEASSATSPTRALAVWGAAILGQLHPRTRPAAVFALVVLVSRAHGSRARRLADRLDRLAVKVAPAIADLESVAARSVPSNRDEHFTRAQLRIRRRLNR